MTPESYLEWEKEQILKHGWYVHFVFDEKSSTRTNIHTHGLPDKYGHLDLQIVIPLKPEIAQGVLCAAVDKISSGSTFSPGDKAAEIIHGYDVKFVKAQECGRDVLRIIIPDKGGGLDRGCFQQENFNFQYEGVDE